MPRLITASFKQRKFVNSYLQHGNIVKATEEAYGTHNVHTSRALGRQTLKQPTTIEYMKRVLDKAGLTDDMVANGLKLITEAGLKESSLKTTTPAHALKALEMAAKLKDLYPAEKQRIEKATISMKLENKSTEELQETLGKLIDEAKSFTRLLKKEIPAKVLDEDAKVLP